MSTVHRCEHEWHRGCRALRDITEGCFSCLVLYCVLDVKPDRCLNHLFQDCPPDLRWSWSAALSSTRPLATGSTHTRCGLRSWVGESYSLLWCGSQSEPFMRSFATKARFFRWEQDLFFLCQRSGTPLSFGQIVTFLKLTTTTWYEENKIKS